MRCVARSLLAGLITVLLTLYIALTSSNVSTHIEYGADDEGGDYDETLRLLEGSDSPSSTSHPQTSLSAVVIVISCLILISILIAGIIVVAMTMDPSSGDEGTSDEEDPLDSHAEMKGTSIFGLSSDYDNLFDEESGHLPVREL